jgi:hypothetical protein
VQLHEVPDPRQKKRCNGQNGSLKIVATGEKEDPPLAA